MAARCSLRSSDLTYCSFHTSSVALSAKDLITRAVYNNLRINAGHETVESPGDIRLTELECSMFFGLWFYCRVGLHARGHGVADDFLG